MTENFTFRLVYNLCLAKARFMLWSVYKYTYKQKILVDTEQGVLPIIRQSLVIQV